MERKICEKNIYIYYFSSIYQFEFFSYAKNIKNVRGQCLSGERIVWNLQTGRFLCTRLSTHAMQPCPLADSITFFPAVKDTTIAQQAVHSIWAEPFEEFAQQL